MTPENPVWVQATIEFNDQIWTQLMKNILVTVTVIGLCLGAPTGFAATVVTLGTISQFTGPVTQFQTLDHS